MADELDLCAECGAELLEIDQKCPSCGADLASTAARRLIGTFLLSDYEVIEVLGQGGMAIVYRGRHRVTGQEAALKVLPPELAARKEIQTRFVDEAKSLAQLDHPNIVHLYNFDADGGALVLAMQLAEGPTWERLILERRLDWQKSIAIALQVCSALDYAHQRGIVHRDMKPSNIIVRASDGVALVTDFGIAKGASDSRLTATGQTMGTVRYMSPEQVRGKEVGKSSDIYSLAVTLYESVAGETPFAGETHFEIMSRHLSALATPLIERVPGIPAGLSEVVAWAMNKRPEDRPESAAVLARALTEVASGASPAIPRPAAESAPVLRPPPAVRRSILPAAIAAVALLAGAAALVIVLNTKGEGTEAAPKATVATAAPVGAEQVISEPVLPAGVVIETDQRFAAENLELRLAADIPIEPYLGAYRAALSQWRRYLAAEGLQTEPEFARPMPNVLLIVAPRDLLCNRASFQSEGEWRECFEVGVYQTRARAILLPHPLDELERAMASSLAIRYCDEAPSRQCLDAATAFQRELFGN